jgi:hypothetical protein
VTVAFASVPAPLDPHTLEGVAIVTAMRIADKARAEGRRGDALLFVDKIAKSGVFRARGRGLMIGSPGDGWRLTWKGSQELARLESVLAERMKRDDVG